MTKKERKILKRLEKLEKLVRRARKGDRRGNKAGCRFDEKRVIDTVTRLVTERVGRVVQKEVQKLDGGRGRGGGGRDHRGGDGRRDDHHDHRGRHEGHGDDRRDDGRSRGRDDGGRGGRRDGRQDWDDRDGRDGGEEKRVVNMVVGLIAHNVQQIVAAELDRRLGPPRDEAEESSDDSAAE